MIYGSGFIPILVYGGYVESREQEDSLLTEDGFNIWTEDSQDILTED